MPTIQVRDITLIERLNKIKPTPTDAYDDVLYELLKRAESKPKLSSLDNLPQLIEDAIKRALDGQLVEKLKSALLPAVDQLEIEIPVHLSVKVRVRLEPVFDITPDAHAYRDGSSNNNDGVATPTNNVGANDRIAELDVLERRVVEFLRQRGGCWEGSAYSLVKTVIGDIDWGLEKRLRRRLKRQDGKICLPDAAQ